MRREDGLTLIELLIVLVVIGILLAISVGSVTGYRERSTNSAAQMNIRSALPAVESYRSDHDGYDGMTAEALQAISPGAQAVDVLAASTSSYCLRTIVEGRSWYREGPSGPITTTACP
jgi:prepilin-type N-terminal cleavage/methylation domain-containing protein